MKIELWSDFLCPYCMIGKKRLSLAIEELKLADAEIEVKSYLLNPDSGEESGRPMIDHLLEKTGMSRDRLEESFQLLAQDGREIGLTLDFDRARYAGTNPAHRLFQHAKTLGVGEALSLRLQAAVFTEGLVIDDPETLVSLAEEIGIPEAEAREALASGHYFDEALREHKEAYLLGVRGVPFFVIDRRFAISGAQPLEIFIQTLREAIA